MNHTGHVERNLREEKITNDVLHADDQTKQDLTDKQADGGGKVVFSYCL